MIETFSILAGDGIITMEWYSWAGLIGIPVILIGYKMYKDKTMT